MLPAKTRFASLTAVALFVWLALSPGHSPTVGQEPAKAQDKGAKIKEMQNEWLSAVRSMVRLDEAKFKVGQGSHDEVFASTRMLAEAELEVCESDQEHVRALEKILATAGDTERLAVTMAKSGVGQESTVLKAKAERLRFAIALEHAKSKAAAKPFDGNTSQDIRDRAALAEKQAAIKQAAVKVVETQKAKAQASLATIKAQVGQARATESHAEMQYQRIHDLFKAKTIDANLLNEQLAKLDAAKAGRLAADSQVAEAESQVAIEQARIAQAVLEHEEAELRMKQLKARLPSQ